jgi:hypothetical protein
LRIVDHRLNDPTSVDDERGRHDVAERDRQALERDLVRRRQRLGTVVVLQPAGVTELTPWLRFSDQPAPFPAPRRFWTHVLLGAKSGV